MATKPKKTKEEKSTPMVIKDNNGNIIAQYDRELIETIKNTVAKNATDEELYMFLRLASEYGLDPWQRELWFIKYGNKDPQIFTSRDGFVKIAKQDENFKSINSFAVYENDDFEIEQEMTENGLEITGFKHKFQAKDRGKILGAYCVIEYYTKKPLMTYCDYKEYSSNTPIWKKNGSAMIRKVSEKEACRLSAGISGLHIPEEMPMYYQSKSKNIMSDEAELQKLEAEVSKLNKKTKEIIDIEIDGD